MKKKAGKMKKGNIAKKVVEGYFSHKLPNISAAIAFYGALSIALLFKIITYFSAIFFGEKALKGELFTFLQFYVGSGSAQLIEKAVGYARTHSSWLSLV